MPTILVVPTSADVISNFYFYFMAYTIKKAIKNNLNKWFKTSKCKATASGNSEFDASPCRRNVRK